MLIDIARSMNDGKIAVFGVLIAVLMVGSIAVLPEIHGGSQSSSVTAVVTSSESTATYTQGHGTIVYSPACNGTAETFGNITFSVSSCVAYGFPSPFVRNATLDTRQVLPYIKTAYEYHLVYFAHNTANSNVMYAVLNVTGSQAVSGNYSSGYQVSYMGNKLLNVTFLKVAFHVFDVTHVSAYSLPDRNGSVSYSPQQAQAISLALSDSNVTSLMAGKSYYANFVGSTGNATAAGGFLVQFYQVDGAGIVGAFVNLGPSSVVDSFYQQRGSGECFPGGIVVTDPWGETGFGCTAAEAPSSTG
jgi:hypothetical protein